MRFGLNYWKLWIASVVSNLGDGVATIAYPWLASALTRNPLHIAAVAVVTRIPWLLFSLPAGVITDRVDRRKLAAWMDVARFAVTLGVAVVVLAAEPQLSSPEAIADGSAAIPQSAGLLLAMVYAAAMLLGTAEVLRDNSAQTLMPALVDKSQLERANGRLWGAEMVMNSFVGPPLAGILMAVAFSLPFFVDAGTFAVSAALVFLIAGGFKPEKEPGSKEVRPSFWAEMKEGVSWLWKHPLFKPMAIALGILNGTFMMALATFVLFAQEVLLLDATGFGLLTTGAAVGGVLGSVFAHRVTKAIGQGASLFAAILVMAVATLVSGLTSSFWIFWGAGLVTSGMAVLWNVITVSLRQSLIPDRLLGRVNSVYRFIGWGMMPIGSLLGGVIVTVAEPAVGREWALRWPFLIAAGLTLVLYFYALPRLNSRRIGEAVAQAEAAPTPSEA
ncbi:MAG: MFS transporter [Actinomycetota bacterium]|nr:MFS transporter [Actinomycetota bacterium]